MKKHKTCDNCKAEFEGYKLNVGLKGVGGGCGAANSAYFYFCGLECLEDFVGQILDDDLLPKTSKILEEAGV